MYQTEKSKYIKTQILAKNEEIKNKYIPDFDLYSKRGLLEMLEKHNTVFVKPDSGSRGHSTFRMRKRGPKINVMDENGRVTNIVESMLPKWSQERYFMQEGIESVGYRDCNVEVRAYLQKLDNKWEVQALIPKISPDAKRFCSVSFRGGKSRPFDEVFSTAPTHFKEEMNRSCLLMATQLNTVLEGVSELGFDMGIDKNYCPRYIEVNTQPLLASVKLLGDTNLLTTLQKNKRILMKKTSPTSIKSALRNLRG